MWKASHQDHERNKRIQDRNTRTKLHGASSELARSFHIYAIKESTHQLATNFHLTKKQLVKNTARLQERIIYAGICSKHAQHTHVFYYIKTSTWLRFHNNTSVLEPIRAKAAAGGQFYLRGGELGTTGQSSSVVHHIQHA